MFIWVARWSVTSLILIILVHYIYTFLIDTLTIPKVKDLVHRPLMRYNEILSDISAPKASKASLVQSEMQTELKTFLMNIKQNITPTVPVPVNDEADYSAY